MQLKLWRLSGIAETMYLSTKFASTYMIFAYAKIDPSQIPIITIILGWILYVITTNIMLKETHLSSIGFTKQNIKLI